MKSALLIIWVAAFAVLATSCGAGSGPPDEAPANTAPTPPVGLTGTWSGTGMDSNENTGQGAIVITWTLTQTDSVVSGTVTTESVDEPGTTCNSCHRNKTGTVSGAIAGTTLTLTMSFPGGGGEITPLCTATLSATASIVDPSSLSGTYSGADSCEGEIVDGTLAMARQP